MSYKIHSIGSARFMVSSLSKDNILNGIDEIKCQQENETKKDETLRIRYRECEYLNIHPLKMI